MWHKERELNVMKIVGRNLLRWFGHVKKMEEERLVKKVYRANVKNNRRKSRPLGMWNNK